VDVFGEVGELIFIGDSNGFVTSLEERTDAFIARIKIANIFGNE